MLGLKPKLFFKHVHLSCYKILTNFSLGNVCIFCEIKIPGKFTVSHASDAGRHVIIILSE